MVLLFSITGCSSGDDGLVLSERVFTDVSDGSKIFKAGFGKDQVIDIAVSRDMFYYLAVKEGEGDSSVSLCSFDMAKTERQTLFSHEDDGTYGSLLDADTPMDAKYGAFGDQVYAFLNGDLQLWNGSGWTMVDSDATEPVNFCIENGRFGAANGDNNVVQLYDAQAAGVTDTLDVSGIGMKELVQANEFYAVWIDVDNTICVYEYETGEAFAVRDAGSEGWEVTLFGKYLVYKGAENPLAWYDLEHGEMMQINTDVSKVNVVYADEEGLWRDLQTSNELIVIK